MGTFLIYAFVFAVLGFVSYKLFKRNKKTSGGSRYNNKKNNPRQKK